MDIDAIKQLADQIRGEVGKAVIGQADTVDLMLTALFSGGHILLEGPPGTAKTLLTQCFAAAIAAATRAKAALEGRDYVVPDDVKSLSLPALRHRVILSPAAEIEGRTTDDTLIEIIEQTAAPR